MTNKEAIKYLIMPFATSTKSYNEYLKQKEAYELAIKALHIVDIINEELNPVDEDKAIWFDIPHWEEIQERADMKGKR